MYPVLIVEGKEYDVDSIDFQGKGIIKNVGIFKNGYYVKFKNIKGNIFENCEKENNCEGQLKWLNRYAKVMEEIEKVIDEKANELTELAKLKMENEKQLPFPDKKTSDLYYNKEREMIGMIHAASIIEEFID